MQEKKENLRKLYVAMLSITTQYFNYSFFALASYELSQYFMPSYEIEDKLLDFFKIFALTIIARPLGSIIFGYISDRFGGKFSLLISSGISTLSIFLIGILPSYDLIGIISLILLIILRMIFLISFAGEVDSTRIYLTDLFSPKKQNYINGLITFSTQLGAILASLSLILSSYTSLKWKLSIFLGAFSGILILISRFLKFNSRIELNILEKKQNIFFKKNLLEDNQINLSLKQIILSHWRRIIKFSLISGLIGSIYYFLIIIIPNILKLTYNINTSKISFFCILCYAVGSLFFGKITEKISSKYIVLLSLIFSLSLILISLYHIENNNINNIGIYVYSASFFLSGYSVPIQMILKNSCNLALRYRIFSMSHSIGSLLISSPTLYLSFKLRLIFDSNLYSFCYVFFISSIVIYFISKMDYKNQII